jgi:superfamily II DNA or RNA helicase
VSDYAAFLERKADVATPTGLPDVPPLGDYLFPFQQDLVSWALRLGKAALFIAVGGGKTRMQLEYAAQASAYLESRGERSEVLILAPLSVGKVQTVPEAARLGMVAKYCKGPEDIEVGAFTVTNYDRLDRFDPRRFGVVVLDESSILKHHDSKTRGRIIEAFRQTPFRLACTATPAPNDRLELGNHSEFLGALTQQEMLSEFFVHDSGKTKDWRLKGHAQERFWQWVASWGAVVSKPADLGYDNAGYDLPPLIEFDHVIGATIAQDREVNQGAAQLNLLPMPARSLKAQRKARRVTLEQRVRAACDIIAAEPWEQWLVWCELNDEADALIHALAAAIPGAVEVRGAHSAEKKEAAAVGFASGSIPVLVSKTSIFGYGLNLQSCARNLFCGVSHSFEDVHQAQGRTHRFGQKREVHSHFVYSELEGDVRRNLARKAREFQAMQDSMRGHVAAFVRENVRGTRRDVVPYNPSMPLAYSRWLAENAERV